MSTDIGSLKATITADTAPYAAGVQKAVQETDKLEKAIKKTGAQTAQVFEVAGRKTTLFGRTSQSAMNKTMNSYRRTTNALDPLAAAMDRFQRQTRDIRNVQRLGIITAEEMRRQINLAKLSYRSAAASANQFAIASTRGMGSTRSMGNAIQQAGFQVGDFSVQVASGQGFLRPFIQQGTQLVSMFGPMGAVIGAVGATLGAVATAFLTSSDAAEETASSYSILQTAITDLNKEAENNIDVNDRQVQSFLDVARAANIQTRAALSGYSASLARASDELDRLRVAQEEAINNPAGGAGAVAGQMAFFAASISTAEEKVTGLQSKVDDLSGALDTQGADIASFGERVNKSVFDQIDATEQLVAALRVNQHEYDVTKTAAALFAREGFTGGIEAAREFAEKLVILGEEMDRIKEVNKDAAAARENVVNIRNQIAANDNLIEALRVSEHEYDVVKQTLALLAKGFVGTEAAAREFAETLIRQNEEMKRLRRTSDDLEQATRRGNAIRASTRTNVEKLAIEQARLNKLYRLGVIDQETLTRSLDDAAKKYRDTTSVAAKFGAIVSSSTDTWVDKIVDGTFKAKDALKLLGAELIKLAASQAFLALLGRDGSKLGSSSSAFGSALASGVGNLFGFQNGGQFQVGGQGGTDSQLVAFKATPNETVSVAKPGQSVGGGGGTVINMDLRGAEVGVEQRVRTVVTQMLPDIAQFNQGVMSRNQRSNRLGGNFG